MVTRSRSSSFLNEDTDCVDGGGPELRRLGRISRSADGRFVLTRDSRSSSLSSSSDDGGFLSHPSFSNRTWSQRPLIGSTSRVMMGSSGVSSGGGGGESVRTETSDSVDSRRRPIVVATVCGPQVPYRSSSPTPKRPAGSAAAAAAVVEYFGQDISAVPGYSERTLRSVHEQYSQQLPSLRVIHEENQRTLMQRQQHHHQQQQHHHHHQQLHPNPARYHPNPRYRSRHMRYARSAPELTSDVPAAVAATVVNERSPESRSSSSGFGSKNTSSHQNTTGPDDWSSRMAVPPYKPPPPPPPSLFYTNEHWLDFTTPILPSPSSHSSASKPISVDDQYEFDPIFPVSPTPTADMFATGMTVTRTPTTPSPSRSRTPTQLKKAKYENVEARLQAMKEEFYAYKRRQAEMARMAYVESAC